MVKKIFISHSSIDTWVTIQIQDKLKALNLSTFLDENCIDIGDDFENVILEELKSSDELLVLLTPWSLNRPYIWIELGAAWAMNIRIIGILYGLTFEEFSANTRNPILIKKTNAVMLNDFDIYLEQLKKRLK